MRRFLKNVVHKKWFPVSLLAAAVCVALAIYTGVSGNDSAVSRALDRALMPAKRGVTRLAVDVAHVYNQLFRYDQMEEENESLRAQVAELKSQLEDAKADTQENAQLRAMLGVAERNTQFTYASAEVIGRTLDEWSSVLELDAGSAEGLEKGDCVVTAEGMVGYITKVSEHSCQVTTTIDSNMAAGARVLRSGELAVAQGDYQRMQDSRLELSYLDKEADVVVGDTVVTSGTGGIFPYGLTIGVVEDIQTESDGMSKYAVIEPAVDIASLTRVYVITDIDVTSEDYQDPYAVAAASDDSGEEDTSDDTYDEEDDASGNAEDEEQASYDDEDAASDTSKDDTEDDTEDEQ